MKKNSVIRYVDDSNVVRQEEICAARIEDYDGNVIRYEEPRLYVGYEDDYGNIMSREEPYLSIENDKEQMIEELTELIKLEHPEELLKHMTEGDIKKLAEKDLEEYYLRYHLRTKSQEKSS